VHQGGDPRPDHLTYRLQHPERRRARGGSHERVDWNAALDEAAGRFAETIRAHGPDSVAFYISGQLMTEDCYVFNKLAKGLIGTNNVDTNSRLCMSSAVAGYKQTLGADAPPCCYEDILQAKVIFIAGANPAVAHPIVFRYIEDARAANQSAHGIHNNAGIIHLHLGTGQIGKPGAGPFSLTGRPNAMGGREVGGLANLLSAHRDLGNPAHRAEMTRFWGVPFVPSRPGKSAVDLFKSLKTGEIKAVWIACTNPAQLLCARHQVPGCRIQDRRDGAGLSAAEGDHELRPVRQGNRPRCRGCARSFGGRC